MLCCKHGGWRVKLSLWPFCGRIPAPIHTIGQVLKAKIFNRCGILPVGLGDPTLINNLRNENQGSSLAVEWQKYPWTRQLEKHESGPHQMAKVRPGEKVVRRRFPARYYGIALVCAVNVRGQNMQICHLLRCKLIDKSTTIDMPICHSLSWIQIDMATINIDFPTFHFPKYCRNVILWNILRLVFVRSDGIYRYSFAVSMCYRAIVQWKT